jgi:hypothetical protein
MGVQVALSGVKKAAIFIAALGEEASSKVFKHLHDSEIEMVARELSALGAVPPEVGERVLTEFNEMSSAADYVNQGGVDYARKLLERTVGIEEARRILDRVARQFKSTVGFAQLERADPQQLSKFILGEHPQTIALIMAHLHPNRARLAPARGHPGGRADAHGEPRRDLARGDLADLDAHWPATHDAGPRQSRTARRHPGRGRTVQPARSHDQQDGAGVDRDRHA